MEVVSPFKTHGVILALGLSSLVSGNLIAASDYNFDLDFNEGPDFYLGGGYHAGVYSGTYLENNVNDFDITGYQIVIGNYFDHNDAFELRLTKGAVVTETGISGVDYEYNLDEALSFFLKHDFALGDNVDLYTLIGYSSTEFTLTTIGESSTTCSGFGPSRTCTTSSSSSSESSEYSGFSYGGGLSINYANAVAFYAEYVSYHRDSGTSDYGNYFANYDSFNAGINILF